MAKGQKRKKNPGVGIDFKRAKHKVGRSIKKGPNDTGVAFRSHAINLPSQSIAEERAGQAVSSHNLTLKELLVQSGHYSERSRVASIAGLTELLTAHPDQLRRNTAAVIEALAPRVADGSDTVRRDLLQLLTTQVLPNTTVDGLRPYLPLLMAHVCSAMSSMSEGIRTDALAVLAAVVDAAPSAVAAGFMQPALEHFNHLLSRGQRGGSLKASSLPALHKVISGLLQFLTNVRNHALFPASAATAQAAASQPQGMDPSSSASAATAAGRVGQDDVMTARQPLMWRSAQGPPPAVVSEYKAALQNLQRPQPIDGSVGKGDDLSSTVCQLAERLLDAFGECSPSTLQMSPELLPAECATATLQTIMMLLPTATQADASKGFRTKLAKIIVPLFPITFPAVAPTAALRASLSSFNLAAAQLLSSLLDTDQGGQQQAPSWATQLVAFYCGVLSTGSALPAQKISMRDQRPSRKLAPDTVKQVLAGVHAVLPHVPQEARDALLAAVVALANSSPAKSAVRAACLELQYELLAAFTRRTHSGPEEQWALVSEDDVVTWVQGLPKLLWELGSSCPARSLLALRLLLDASRCAAPGGHLACTLQTLQPQLLPLLCLLTTQPEQKQSKVASSSPVFQDGSAQKSLDSATASAAGPKLIVGVLARLPPLCQELAIDVLSFQEPLQEATLRTFAIVALTSAYSPCLGSRAIAVAAAGAALQGGRPPPPPGPMADAAAASSSAYHSMLGALILGAMTGIEADDSWHRHVTIVDAACSALTCTGHTGSTWAVLEPLLLQRLTSSSAQGELQHRSLYGFLRTVAAMSANRIAHDTQVPSCETSKLEEEPNGSCGSGARDEANANGEVAGTGGCGLLDGHQHAQAAQQTEANECRRPAEHVLSRELKAALPMLMWRYTAWYTSATSGHVPSHTSAVSINPSTSDKLTSSIQQTTNSTTTVTSAGGTREARESSRTKAIDVAASENATDSPGLSPVLSLLHLMPDLLPPLLGTLGLAARNEISGGSLQSSIEASLSLLQAILDDRALQKYILEHASEVQGAISAISAAADIVEQDGLGSVTKSVHSIAQQLQITRNTANILFGF